MMNKIRQLLLPLLAAIWMAASSGQAQERKPLVFIHVTIIDAISRPVQPDMTVVITGDHVTALGKSSKTHVPQGAEIVDASDRFLIPGLWDTHVHLVGSKDLLLSMLVANGITGVRDMG